MFSYTSFKKFNINKTIQWKIRKKNERIVLEANLEKRTLKITKNTAFCRTTFVVFFDTLVFTSFVWLSFDYNNFKLYTEQRVVRRKFKADKAHLTTKIEKKLWNSDENTFFYVQEREIEIANHHFLNILKSQYWEKTHLYTKFWNLLFLGLGWGLRVLKLGKI